MRSTEADLVLRRFGRRIAELRVEKGLTQEQLAERAKCSARYIQMVESGTNLSIRTASGFAKVLRVELAELFTRPSGKPTRMPRRARRRRR